METEGLRLTHHRDQASAALGQVTDVEKRAAHRSGYPLWFWLLSGVGFAAQPASTLAGAGREIVALIGVGIVLLAVLAVSRGRRVQEQCLTLGVRGWCREVVVFLPAILVVVAGVVASNIAADAWVAVVASGAAAVVWVGVGALSGKISSTTR